MDLPCLETFGPSRLPWPGRIGTTAAADFCAHESGHPGRPAFRASPTHGYASQISPNKSVNFRCTSSPSTLESVGNGFAVHGQLTSGSLWASMAFLFVASQLWRERCRLLHRSRVRRLPSHGSSPPRSCLRLVLRLFGLHLVCCPPINSRFRTGDLHPTSSRPCRAYRAPEPPIRSELNGESLAAAR